MNYLGHIDATTLLSVVERGDMLGVELGRLVRHLRADGHRHILHTGPRSPFAICTECGVFAQVQYTVGEDPFCSHKCTGIGA